ncbi:MAG: hypothetical protein JW829_07725 [Pirellulales bacterium]|nr:hypothetical protein [Pirellulales bacterium]
MRHYRIIVGILIWSVMIGILVFWLNRHDFSQVDGGTRLVNDLWEFATAERRMIKLEFDQPWPVTVGDPIYTMQKPGSIEQVGEIRRLMFKDRWLDKRFAISTAAESLLYPNAPEISDPSHLVYYTTPRSLTWVIETMLPLEKREVIAQEIARTYEDYHSEILQALEPVLVGGFLDAMRIVEKDLAQAVSKRRVELEKLGSRYQDHVLQQEIIPLFYDEIWPIIQRHAEPLANQIGQEMFERMSLWRFGWRFLYDKTPLPQKDLARAEWNRFINREGIPILNRHKADMIEVQKKIFEDISANDAVRNTIRENLIRIADDPEFRSIVWKIFREVLLDNPRLQEAFEARWRGPEAKRAMQLAASYTEPCVRRIGDLLLGTREEGIAPEFAQVLRNQILDKDCYWFVLETSPDGPPIDPSTKPITLPVHRGKHPVINPFAAQLQEIRR